MPELTTHLDDFTLLRYVAEDLDESERTAARDHLRACGKCRTTIGEIEDLDRELRAVATSPQTRGDFELEDLPEADPFRPRSHPAARRVLNGSDSSSFAAVAVAASEEGAALSAVVLEAAKRSPRELAEVLSRLSLSHLTDRFSLLYALQQGGVEIAENPTALKSFAEASLGLLCRDTDASSFAGSCVPTAILIGQAHLVAGYGYIWASELEQVRLHSELAYRAFMSAGDETGLAKADLLEAQRRFFIGKGKEALLLARRSAATFESFDLEVDSARAHQAEGMALDLLGRWQDAANAFKLCFAVFERHCLWTNYISALNALGTILTKMGRLHEARREYARALRRISRDRNRSWLPLIRKGLAEVLFSAGRYREAAIAAGQAARLWSELGLPSRSLMVTLFEAESWARSSDLGRARHRLELFRSEVSKRGMLDAVLANLIDQVFSGAFPDFQKIAELRQVVDRNLKQRLEATA